MDPKTVVIRYVEAARDGMSAVIRDSFAEDATWEYPGDLPLSGTYRGVDAIVTEFLGGAYRNRNAGIFTVRDGKIVSVREYTDTQHVARVLL